MNAISNVYMRAISEAQTGDHSPKTIALYCGIGLAASLCMAAFGLDTSAGFF
jgi:hypothetical protein